MYIWNIVGSLSVLQTYKVGLVVIEGIQNRLHPYAHILEYDLQWLIGICNSFIVTEVNSRVNFANVFANLL